LSVIRLPPAEEFTTDIYGISTKFKMLTTDICNASKNQGGNFPVVSNIEGIYPPPKARRCKKALILQKFFVVFVIFVEDLS